MEYAGLVENSNDLIQVVDFDGYLLYVNRTWSDTLGYSRDELSGKKFFDLLYDRSNCTCQERIELLRQGKPVPRFEITYKNRQGEKIIAEGNVSLYCENGEPKGVQGIFRDITDKKKTELELSNTEARFQTIFESSVAGIAMLAPDGQFLQSNPALCNFLGYTLDELRQLKITDVTHPEDVEETIRRRNIALAEKSSSLVCEKRYLRKDGSTFWAQLSSAWYFDNDGNPLYTVPVIQDITLRKLAEMEIRKLAHYDGLTGIPNRSLFTERLNHELEQAQANSRPFALIFLDLDRFKGVNDILGHAEGDKMLCQAADRLKKCLRANDTVSRLGGDEFVILLSGFKEEKNLTKVCNKILEDLSRPYFLGMRSISCTTSVGVSVFPNDGNNATDLLRHADMAMYAAKDAGGNCFRFYSQEMTARAVSRMELEEDLRQALVKDEFVMEYQPQIDLVNKKVAGIEALLRWNRPLSGMVPPEQFIPLAEETNLILGIGEWVMKTVFRQCAAWEQLGHLQLRVGINISGRQFVQSDFIDRVEQLLEETGANPQLLEFEITESVVMNDVDMVINTLRRLRELGISIAIDDFGTGYSSLSYLKLLPLSCLKIDKSFISEVNNNLEDRAIVEATIAMSKRLGLKVIAEGVETQEQCLFIRSQNCDEAQGYFFSRAVSAEEIEKKWLTITDMENSCQELLDRMAALNGAS